MHLEAANVLLGRIAIYVSKAIGKVKSSLSYLCMDDNSCLLSVQDHEIHVVISQRQGLNESTSTSSFRLFQVYIPIQISLSIGLLPSES